MSAAFEGPPSPVDMESVCTNLLWKDDAGRAWQLAEVMVTWWHAQPRTGDIERSSRFYLWVGMWTVLSAIVGRAENRKIYRAAKRQLRRSR